METEDYPEMIARQHKQQVELPQTLARADKDVVAILPEERADDDR